MLLWSLKVGIVSFLLIFLVHHIFNFLKTTLTVPKVKDLVNQSKQDYDNIFRVIEQGYVQSDVEEPDPEAMKNELKNFLKNQMNASGTTSLDSLPSNAPY